MTKRFATLLVPLLLIVLAACQPATTVETNVLPTLFSVTVNADGSMLIQGRYFGDGQGGTSSGSYVIVGADISGAGGLQVSPSDWGTGRISLSVPDGAGSGFVYVVVGGVRSNGLPANLR